MEIIISLLKLMKKYHICRYIFISLIQGIYTLKLTTLDLVLIILKFLVDFNRVLNDQNLLKQK